MQQNYIIEKKENKTLADTPSFPDKKRDETSKSGTDPDISEKCIRLILSFSKNVDLRKSVLLEQTIEYLKS
jgi:hypothetical protein